MKTVDKTEESIRYSLTQMWQLVATQINDAKIATLTNDKTIANDVLVRERLVDNYELLIDKSCEQFTALQNPVAIDLRFVLSHLKMNSDLERIGDLAEGVATCVSKHQNSIYSKEYNLEELFETILRMLELAYQSYLTNDTELAIKVITTDSEVDLLYHKAMGVLAKECVGKNEQQMRDLLYFSNCLRRIERIGDRCTNLAENIIFHIDARELKHADNIPIFDTL